MPRPSPGPPSGSEAEGVLAADEASQQYPAVGASAVSCGGVKWGKSQWGKNVAELPAVPELSNETSEVEEEEEAWTPTARSPRGAAPTEVVTALQDLQMHVAVEIQGVLAMLEQGSFVPKNGRSGKRPSSKETDKAQYDLIESEDSKKRRSEGNVLEVQEIGSDGHKERAGYTGPGPQLFTYGTKGLQRQCTNVKLGKVRWSNTGGWSDRTPQDRLRGASSEWNFPAWTSFGLGSERSAAGNDAQANDQAQARPVSPIISSEQEQRPNTAGRMSIGAKERSSTADLELRMKVEDLRTSNTCSVGQNMSKNYIGRSSEHIDAGTPLQMWIRSNTFEFIWIILVAVNSIFIGVQTQCAATNMRSVNQEPIAFRVISHIFSVLFMIELALRIYGSGCRNLFCGPNMAWAWLDAVIVLSSVTEVVIDTVIPTTLSEDESLDPSSLRTVRIIRLARFARALRVQRLVHMVSGLRTLVYSIAVTLKQLLWALVLLTIIMYTVGVTLTQVVVDSLVQGGYSRHCEDRLKFYWKSLDVSMLTLFQAIANGLSWDEAARPLGEVSMVLVWILCGYVAFTYFAVLNVVTGVFCHSAIESAQKNPDVIAQALIANQKGYVRNIERLFGLIDQDQSQTISFAEFEQVIADPENRAYLAALEIEAMDAWTLFKLLDVNKDGEIRMEEFVNGCLQLKGVAKNVEIANLAYGQDRLERRLGRVTNQLHDCRDVLRQVYGPGRKKACRPGAAGTPASGNGPSGGGESAQSN